MNLTPNYKIQLKRLLWGTVNENLVIYSQIVLLVLLLICCKSDNDHRISTITIERVEAGKFIHYSWRLIADPPPTKNLVVLIGREDKPENWFDYDRGVLHQGLKNRKRPPYYVVIGKSNRHSQINHTSLGYFSDYSFPIYINLLPSVSVVGRGVEIDTDTLSKTLPATTYGGHIIPKGHKFVRYRVGNPCGIDKEGNLLKRETRVLKQ